MKVKKFSIIMLKYAIFLLLVCGVLILSSSQAYCEGYNLKTKDANTKPTLKDKDNPQQLNNIPYPSISDEIPLVSDAKVSNINETVSGLMEAGYTLGEIVTVLKNDNYNAPKISITCLKAGYNGTKIFKAMLESGFSKATAEAAVPAALRTSSQPLAIYNSNPDSVEAEMTLIAPNPFSFDASKELSQKTTIQKEEKVKTQDVNPLEVPISVGVTFNGLGNWNAFQDERFNNTLK